MDNTYTCHSLAIAAFLRLRGHSCRIELDPQDNSRAVFVFQRDAEGKLDHDIVDFQSGSGAVPPRLFKGVEIELRDEMFAVLRERGGQRR